MIIKCFINPPLGNNNYVVIDERTHQAVMIDCSQDAEKMLSFIAEQKATLAYILITHGHFDHVLGAKAMQDKTGVPVYLSQTDMRIFDEMNAYTAKMNLPKAEPVKWTPLPDKEIKFADQMIQIFPTPGHTQGSVCFLLDHYLFSGDTLFYRACGRTDLWQGNPKQMEASLHFLLTLPDETIVYPGHGNKTTIAASRLWLENNVS